MWFKKSFSLGNIYIFEKNFFSHFHCVYLYQKRAFYKKPPLEKSFLSSNWVPIKVKRKFLLEKVTQLIFQPGVEACYPISYISWVICNKVRFYLCYTDCSPWVKGPKWGLWYQKGGTKLDPNILISYSPGRYISEDTGRRSTGRKVEKTWLELVSPFWYRKVVWLTDYFVKYDVHGTVDKFLETLCH